VQTVGVRGGT